MHQRRKLGNMFVLTTMLLIGFASAQKVIQLSYCSIDEDHLRMDCKYSLPAESPEPFCKYTQGERLFDTTFPDEEQHAPFKKRARVRLFPGNNCRLLFKNLPNGKSNFTCNIKQGDSAIAVKTSVVEKKLLLPCSAWSVLLQSCSRLLLTLMTFPMLLEIHWL
ncbi:thy-1 membrane glycoprotein [Brachyistius frenatus]|uniref:thy-1 membrane glycoprotein n=1 Tax=Brachyistius frenatus TaxID=100188 RepID=UPI0037E86ED2